jgi:hypothetical protein
VKSPAVPLRDFDVPIKTIAMPTKKLPNKKPGKIQLRPATKKRFEEYLDKKKSKCWEWKGSRTEDGYGQFWVDEGKVVKAHRLAYELYVRQLSKKERLRNICNNKNCINPQCWEPFTIGQGAAVKKAKTSVGKKSARK